VYPKHFLLTASKITLKKKIFLYIYRGIMTDLNLPKALFVDWLIHALNFCVVKIMVLIEGGGEGVGRIHWYTHTHTHTHTHT